MARRSLGLGTVLAGTLSLVGACDPCAGTPSCTSQPEVSYTGSFIERFSARSVSGVQIMFVRSAGVLMSEDTAVAISDDGGFFTLRAAALGDGEVQGSLHVNPPAPYRPYVVNGVRLRTTRRRGDGGVLGRMVVNPYLQLVGEVRDATTGEPVPSARVRIIVTNTTPVIEGATTIEVSTAENGRFLWEPVITRYDTISADVEIIDGRWSRPMQLHRSISPQYVDGPPAFLLLYVGPSMRHSGLATRRGYGPGVAGVTLEFVRTSGSLIAPDSFVVVAADDGLFVLSPTPVEGGVVTGRLTVRATGYPTETYTTQLRASDDGETRFLGHFGYGAAALVGARFTYRSSGEPIDSGTLVRVSRVSGLPILVPPLSTDSGLRAVDGNGVMLYGTGALEVGDVFFDLEVRLPAPMTWDTLRAVRVPARFSSVIDTLPFSVGPP